MFRLLTNKRYNEWFKSIEQILNVLFKYKWKRNAHTTNHGLFDYKTRLKTSHFDIWSIWPLNLNTKKVNLNMSNLTLVVFWLPIRWYFFD